jgi:hypothetical protein
MNGEPCEVFNAAMRTLPRVFERRHRFYDDIVHSSGCCMYTLQRDAKVLDAKMFVSFCARRTNQDDGYILFRASL